MSVAGHRGVTGADEAGRGHAGTAADGVGAAGRCADAAAGSTTAPVRPAAAPAPARPAPELTHRFAELLAAASLARAILRREARGLAVWTAGLGLLAWYSCVALRDTYSTATLRAAAAALERTPGVAAFTGPGLGMEAAASGDPATAPVVSAIVANEVLLYVALGAAVLAILTVIRHTRATEETGQAELVRAGALRRGGEGAVVLLVLDMELTAVGIAVLVGLILGGMSVGGSFLFAGAAVGVGAVMGTTALLLAQLAPSARAARGLALLALLAAFETRALGDVLRVSDRPGGWISLLSPIGWAQATGPWTVDRWWWLLVPVVVADVVGLVALRLSVRREIGVPSFPLPEAPGADRPGPRGHLALALRTRGAALAWWVVAGVVVGLLYGSLTGSVQDTLGRMLEQSPYLQAFLGGRLTPRSFLDTVLLYVVLLAAAAGVGLVLSVWREERGGRADVVVAAPRSRATRLVDGVVVAAGGSLAVLVAGGACLGVTGAATAGDWALARDALLAAVGAWPACLVLIGAAALLIGVGRSAGAVGWSLYAAAACVAALAGALDLPQWVRDLSPLTHSPRVLALGLGADGVSWTGAAVMLVLAVVLAGAGAWLVGRRDLR
ncbi:hypothetical protein [Actinomyces radicidentis]|uniref:hypothetical protein n=1 Tax=Actinomyces radicidentis TaxID=111015 RepID=UPI0028E999F2|nr:hypothetical protein [Actinomyces radicidentis]